MNMTNMKNPKPWAEGHPSLYQGHDITHRPDWANIIVWDAFFNNLTAGFMVLTGIAWFAGPPLFAALLPFALTLALLIVIVDLVLLVFDLGDPPRSSTRCACCISLLRFPWVFGAWLAMRPA